MTVGAFVWDVIKEYFGFTPTRHGVDFSILEVWNCLVSILESKQEGVSNNWNSKNKGVLKVSTV